MTNQKPKNKSAAVDWNFWKAERLDRCCPRTIERTLIVTLKELHEIALELARTDSPEALFRRAVELGKSHLGFDLMSIWLLGDEPGVAKGLFFINETGTVFDEKDRRWLCHGDPFIGKVLEEKSLFSQDYDRNDGETKTGSYAYAPITNAGDVLGFIVCDIFTGLPTSLGRVLRLYGDILGRLYARLLLNAELQAQHDRSHLIMSNINDVVWVMDKEKMTYISPSVEKRDGYSVDEALNIDRSDTLTPESLKILDAFHEKEVKQYLMADHPVPFKSWILELQFYKADGSIYPGEINFSLLRDRQDHPVGLLGVTRDISERKRTEVATKASENRFYSFFKQSPIPVELYNADGLLIDLNSAARDYCKPYAEEPINNYNMFTCSFFPDEMLKLAREGKEFRTVLEVDYSKIPEGHFQYPKHANIVKFWDVALTPLKHDGEDRPYCYLQQFQDITDAKLAEKSLRESERKFRVLVEQLPAFTYFTNLDGNSPSSYTSPQVETLLGVSADEWDSDPSIYYSLIHPEDRERVTAELKKCRKKNLPYAMEYRINTRDGRLLWVRDEALFIRGEDGEIQFVLGLMLDISGRKQAEIHQTELRRFRERERIRTEFLSLTSHELRTPLTPIRGALDMLLGGLTGAITEEQKQILQVADQHTEHLRRLVNDLLDIFRLESGRMPMRKKPASICNIIENSCAAYEERFREKGLALKLELDEDNPAINCDPARIGQVLDNLLYNRLWYTQEGEVTISMSQEKQNMLLKLSDAGIVVSPERASMIFQRFFKMDSSSEGAGLSLALAKHLVEAHEGTISFESETGKGSTFYIRLPIE